jgi:hypothetical protein
LSEFHPERALLDSPAAPRCRATVIVPARNEEASLPAALNALARQAPAGLGRPGCCEEWDWSCYEVLLLLNNCTDESAGAARAWALRHPGFQLQVVERTLPPEQAHVGTARRMLMDTAWHRLRGRSGAAMLSTDADTVVAKDWIAQNLAALERGADAVGGMIALKPGDLEKLPEGARRGYLRDRRYQRLVAQLEDRLDPQACDPWPRHLQHFGASLACTPEIYARAGGLPAVKPLEDVAFVNQLRRAGARLRHEPKVKVYTSSRLHGRAEVGLSGQLSLWQRMSDSGEEHRVLSAAWLEHRFRTLRGLRQFYGGGCAEPLPEGWMERLREVRARELGVEEFLVEIECERLIEETFHGEREGGIVSVNRRLAVLLRQPAL